VGGTLDPEEIHAVLVRAVRRVCPPWLASRSEDLVQSAWVRIEEASRRSGEERDLRPAYVWKAAWSAVADEVRRARMEAQVTRSPEPLDAIPARAPGGDAGAHAASVRRAIAECLRAIRPPRRRAVVLHLLGYGSEEVAALEGWGPKQARNLIFRALRQVRACLEAKGMRP
jgi:RNA polymerase sigma-70 factor (ECF subfamily)